MLHTFNYDYKCRDIHVAPLLWYNTKMAEEVIFRANYINTNLLILRKLRLA